MWHHKWTAICLGNHLLLHIHTSIIVNQKHFADYKTLQTHIRLRNTFRRIQINALKVIFSGIHFTFWEGCSIVNDCYSSISIVQNCLNYLDIFVFLIERNKHNIVKKICIRLRRIFVVACVHVSLIFVQNRVKKLFYQPFCF